jgi:hypothetical protein
MRPFIGRDLATGAIALAACLSALLPAGCAAQLQTKEVLPFGVIDLAPVGPGAAVITSGWALARLTAVGEHWLISPPGNMEALAAERGDVWVLADGSVHRRMPEGWHSWRVPMPPDRFVFSTAPGNQLLALDPGSALVAMRVGRRMPYGAERPPIATLTARMAEGGASEPSILESFEVATSFRGADGAPALGDARGKLARLAGGRWLLSPAALTAVPVGDDGRGGIFTWDAPTRALRRERGGRAEPLLGDVGGVSSEGASGVVAAICSGSRLSLTRVSGVAAPIIERVPIERRIQKIACDSNAVVVRGAAGEVWMAARLLDEWLVLYRGPNGWGSFARRDAPKRRGQSVADMLGIDSPQKAFSAIGVVFLLIGALLVAKLGGRSRGETALLFGPLAGAMAGAAVALAELPLALRGRGEGAVAAFDLILLGPLAIVPLAAAGAWCGGEAAAGRSAHPIRAALAALSARLSASPPLRCSSGSLLAPQPS